MKKEIDLTPFREICDKVCKTENYLSLKNYVAHGRVSVYAHSLRVAEKSYAYAVKHRVKCDIPSLVRGALLHDYFLYDWHKLPKFSFHGYTHAKTAMENASIDYDLNEKEKNIIYSHMFPLNLFHFPKCKEAWIVLWQDKICALKETLCER